jgi:uncharacterized protein (TIGR03067 family)
VINMPAPEKAVMSRISVAVVLVAAVTLRADDPKGAKLPDGQKAFEGTWKVVDQEKGKKSDEPLTARTVEFRGDRYTIKAADTVFEEGTFEANARHSPRQIDITVTSGKDKGKKWHGVYELEGDNLRMTVSPAHKPLPDSLEKPSPGERSFTLRRAKTEKR